MERKTQIKQQYKMFLILKIDWWFNKMYKNDFKKIIIPTLIVALMFSLVGCGSGSSASTNSNKHESSTEIIESSVSTTDDTKSNKTKESQVFPLNPTSIYKTIIGIISESGSLKCIYDWDYPTTFMTERSIIFELMKTVDNYYYSYRNVTSANMPDMVNLRLDKDTFVQTLNDPDYFYYGNTKDNKPEGYGILYYANSNGPIFAGEFKNGKPNGYGMSFLNLGEISWECDDATFDGKEFIANGNSIRYFNHYDNNNKSFNASSNHIRRNYWHYYYQELEDMRDNVLSKEEYAELEEYYASLDGFIHKEHLVLRPSVEYQGELKDLKCNGAGKLFYDAFQNTSEKDHDFVGTSCYGPLRYEGQYKNDKWNGSGKLYYYDGTLFYDGEFKDNTYHGSGTLYNNDGSIKYSGKFKNGDISK